MYQYVLTTVVLYKQFIMNVRFLILLLDMGRQDRGSLEVQFNKKRKEAVYLGTYIGVYT